jgi:2-polyprenyl-3-methyl-5-hydroxy-6-metoxy-1,4-benzoquinol methylase
MTTATTIAPDQSIIEQKQGVAFGALRGLYISAMAHIGVRLGLYEVLAGAGPITSSEVARRAGLHERFVREWLLQQTASEVLEHRGDGRYELSAEAALLFADRESPASLVAMFEELPEVTNFLVRAQEGFRSGLGNSYDAYGSRIANVMEAVFGAWNRSALVPDALPKIPGLVEKLEAGARVADVGCGGGSAPLSIAKAFPNSTVDAYENSLHALAVCEESLRKQPLPNVRFLNNDVTPLPGEPTYDFVLTLDCLHDMPRPDLISRQIRQAIKPDGAWFIVDIDAAESPESNLAHPMGALMFASSVTLCLQSGASTPDGLALGTMGLPEPEMRKLVTNAGFTRFRRVEGLHHPFNAYYEARP